MPTEIDDEFLESAIPPWGDGGILPPFRDSPAKREGTSPFRCSIESFVWRFLDEPEGTQDSKRRDLLRGFLDYRAALRLMGFQGFQCVSGSFVEQIESIRGRTPNDLDVVNFLNPPFADGVAGLTELLSWLNDKHLLSGKAKARYGVDGHLVILDKFAPEYVVEETQYWLGLASHQRQSLKWKGITRVELSIEESEDAAARRIVDEWRSP